MRACGTAGLWRFETDREITVVAAAPILRPRKWPVGTRIPVDGNGLAMLVQRSATRTDRQLRQRRRGDRCRVRVVGVRSAVGVPIIVDGRVWGLVAVGSLQPGAMPADTEIQSAASPTDRPCTGGRSSRRAEAGSYSLRRHDGRI